MGKIVNLEQIQNISKQLRRQGKSIVLAGGCFDILHPGHEFFLKKASLAGDVLMLLLESDKNVKRLKGKGRPVNSQKKRGQKLAKLEMVDYVILLGEIIGDEGYFEITKKISPEVIAVTRGDRKLWEKEQQAKIVGGKVLTVCRRLKKYSTTEILKKNDENFRD